jgi:hypothetical protein
MSELKITVSTERDNDATPFDADCYTPEDIQAWRNDEWHYVGVVVDVLFRGVVIGNASLWGIGTGGGNGGCEIDPAYHQEVVENLTPVALADARSFLEKAATELASLD